MFRTFFIMDLRIVSKYVEHESWSVSHTLHFWFKLRLVLCTMERNIEAQSRRIEEDERWVPRMEFVMPSLAFCRTVARHILMAFFFTIKAVSGLEANCELVLSFVLFPTISSLRHLGRYWESYELLKS